jgi:hypothetical protein
MKKSSDKKKKAPSTTNLFLKLNDKADKINFKLALNMLIPKTVSLLNSPKAADSKAYKMAVVTPKPKPNKKSLKENSYQSAFVSNNSYTTTPYEFEQQIKIKEKSRNDYKFLYQVGSGGFGRVWKV